MRIAKWIFIIGLSLLLCACGLLPQEEEYAKKPMIRAYTQEEYKLGYVQYGDVVVSDIISCKYLPVKTQQCRFPLSGIYYDEVFVQKGDLVEAGQLLAQLDVSGLKEEITALERGIAQIERGIHNLREQAVLAVATQRQILSVHTQPAQLQSVQELQEDYDARIAALQEDLFIAQMRLSEAHEKLADRSLYAEIDGAVTFARKVESGMRSTEGELVVSIADASSSVFYAETANYALMPEGTVISISINKRSIPATVVSAESLGLTDAASTPSKRTVYLQLSTPDADLESGDRGSITLTVKKAENTLFIPKQALHQIDDRTFVYQADENGLKCMKNVEVGLVSNRYVEILQGLSEGENVICQ